MNIMYHGTDADGWASAFIVDYYGKERDENETTFIALVRGKREVEISDLVPNTKIVIIDWSFSEANLDVLDYIVDNNIDVLWIDHHKTSVELLNKYPKYNKIKHVINTEYCAASLAYTYFTGREYNMSPEWIQLISQYDTFNGITEKAKVFNFALKTSDTRPYSNHSIWYKLVSYHDVYPTFEHLIKLGTELKHYEERQNHLYLKANAFECTIHGIKCIACNKMSNSMLFGSQYSEYPICCTFIFDGFKYKYTLYSNTTIFDVDCSKIAEEYSGGGHKGAAGFITDHIIFENIKEIGFENNHE